MRVYRGRQLRESAGMRQEREKAARKKAARKKESGRVV
jgi:hypothetical protein